VTHEKSEVLGNRVSKDWNQIQEFENMMLKKFDFIKFQEDTKNKMKFFKYSIKEKVEQLHKFMKVMLINSLDVRLPKSDHVTLGTHENKDKFFF
jgi:hypothetical protein